MENSVFHFNHPSRKHPKMVKKKKKFLTRFLFCAVDCVYSACSYCLGPHLDQQSCTTESCQKLAVTKWTRTVEIV